MCECANDKLDSHPYDLHMHVCDKHIDNYAILNNTVKYNWLLIVIFYQYNKLRYKTFTIFFQEHKAKKLKLLWIFYKLICISSKLFKIMHIDEKSKTSGVVFWPIDYNINGSMKTQACFMHM